MTSVDDPRTSVINCKVQYIRPKYKDLKEWMEDANNVYIGRGGVVFIDKVRFPSKSSPFCNPFKIGKDGTRDDVLIKYEEYIKERLKDPHFKEELMKLKGKTLGCWCKPEKCHGDILLKFI